METDICTCKKTRGQHDGTGLDGSCLTFTIDRKATYWAERRAVVIQRSAQLQADIQSGRVVRRRMFPEDAPADREERKASLLGQLDALVRGEAQP